MSGNAGFEGEFGMEDQGMWRANVRARSRILQQYDALRIVDGQNQGKGQRQTASARSKWRDI